MKKWLKTLSLCGAAFLGFAAVLYLCAWMFRPRLATTPIARSSQEAKSIEKLRDVSFDPKNPPVVQRDVDYSQGRAASWFPKGQSPILAELVKEKKLPPVAQRVGSEPLVLQGVDGIGKYGGTWQRLATSPSDVG